MGGDFSINGNAAKFSRTTRESGSDFSYQTWDFRLLVCVNQGANFHFPAYHWGGGEIATLHPVSLKPRVTNPKSDSYKYLQLNRKWNFETFQILAKISHPVRAY